VSIALSDQAARERITGDLDVEPGVEAGAGTGKTTVLVERVTNVLATGTGHGRRAGGDHLHREGGGRALDPGARRARADARPRTGGDEQRERVLAAARDLYRCHIETIHSFAGGLLRERPVEAGIDPLFDVVDGLAGSLDFDAAYERFQDELLSARSPELDRALRRGLGLDELREACELLNQHRYLRPLEHPAHHDGELDHPSAEFRRDRRRAARTAGRLRPRRGHKAVEFVEGILDWVDALEALEDRGRAGVPAALPRPGLHPRSSAGRRRTGARARQR
jgi:ATP-dependent exoDNAse (exonuclease V) beta subunit